MNGTVAGVPLPHRTVYRLTRMDTRDTTGELNSAIKELRLQTAHHNHIYKTYNNAHN